MKYERRKILTCFAVLIALCFIVIVGGRMVSGNRLKVAWKFDEDQMPENPDQLLIKWDKGEMNVVNQELIEDDVLMIELTPKEAKVNILRVVDQKGITYFTDELRVKPLGIAYSVESRNFTGDTAVISGLVLLFLGLAALNLLYFLELQGPNFYSYDSILACGAGMFCTVTGLNLFDTSVMRLVEPEKYWMRYVYEFLGQAGSTFMLYTFPILLIFSVLLIISNIELLRHERFRVKNVLGLGIGVGLILGELGALPLVFYDGNLTLKGLRILYIVTSVYGTVFTYFECILAGAVICGFRAAAHVPKTDQDYIIILGCGFRKDGTLPPLLRGRVDKAIEFWKKQTQENQKSAIFIPSGGQGRDEPMAEAEAMGRYLRECGIPEENLLEENQSKNTYQNMEFSKKIIEDRDGEKEQHKAIYVTTNYHVFRSGLWANLAGLHIEGLGSKTKWWYWPNAFIRECAGLAANRIWQEAVALIVLILIFAGFSILTI